MCYLGAMSWLRWGLLVIACATVACGDDGSSSGSGGAGGEGQGGSDVTCSLGSAVPGMVTTYPLSHGGRDRSYNLFVPSTFDGSKALPLVLNFHGFTSNASQQQVFSELNILAEQEGFLVAYPEGISSSFNGGSVCCGTAAAENVDDVGFARAIVADVAQIACVDPKRTYSTGMSNGGFMSHRLACEAADLIAAVAPVDGLLGIPTESCNPSRPVPIIHFYGTEDPLVDYNFAQLTNDFWVDKYACSDAAPEVTFQNGVATCETWKACQDGATVTMCTVEGGGHCWPGQTFCPPELGSATTDISANEEMWAFFRERTLE